MTILKLLKRDYKNEPDILETLFKNFIVQIITASITCKAEKAAFILKNFNQIQNLFIEFSRELTGEILKDSLFLKHLNSRSSYFLWKYFEKKYFHKILSFVTLYSDSKKLNLFTKNQIFSKLEKNTWETEYEKALLNNDSDLIQCMDQSLELLFINGSQEELLKLYKYLSLMYDEESKQFETKYVTKNNKNFKRLEVLKNSAITKPILVENVKEFNKIYTIRNPYIRACLNV